MKFFFILILFVSFPICSEPFTNFNVGTNTTVTSLLTARDSCLNAIGINTNDLTSIKRNYITIGANNQSCFWLADGDYIVTQNDRKLEITASDSGWYLLQYPISPFVNNTENSPNPEHLNYIFTENMSRWLVTLPATCPNFWEGAFVERNQGFCAGCNYTASTQTNSVDILSYGLSTSDSDEEKTCSIPDDPYYVNRPTQRNGIRCSISYSYNLANSVMYDGNNDGFARHFNILNYERNPSSNATSINHYSSTIPSTYPPPFISRCDTTKPVNTTLVDVIYPNGTTGFYTDDIQEPDQWKNVFECLKTNSCVGTDEIYAADQDSDGIPDAFDTFPTNPQEWYDYDGDGTGNNSDPYPSDSTLGTENDGIGNYTGHLAIFGYNSYSLTQTDTGTIIDYSSGSGTGTGTYTIIQNEDGTTTRINADGTTTTTNLDGTETTHDANGNVIDPNSGTGGTGGTGGSASVSDNCTTAPTCTGDIVQCSILQQVWQSGCDVQQSSASQGTPVTGGTSCQDPPVCDESKAECRQLVIDFGIACAIESGELPDITGEEYQFLEDETFNVFSSINDILGQTPTASSCPAPYLFNLGSLGGNSIEMSYQIICDWASAFSPFVLLLAYFVSFKIISRGLFGA